MIYEPAEDSFLLAKFVRDRSKDKVVLDMGSGSGIQAETALEGGAKRVLCVDVDVEAVQILKGKGFDAVKSDLFSKISSKEKFDLIVFNPPYLPRDPREDSESARVTSGDERGDEIVIRFLKSAGKFLAKNGEILLLLSSLTPLERVNEILARDGFVREVIGSEKSFMEMLEVWAIRKS